MQQKKINTGHETFCFINWNKCIWYSIALSIDYFAPVILEKWLFSIPGACSTKHVWSQKTILTNFYDQVKVYSVWNSLSWDYSLSEKLFQQFLLKQPSHSLRDCFAHWYGEGHQTRDMMKSLDDSNMNAESGYFFTGRHWEIEERNKFFCK